MPFGKPDDFALNPHFLGAGGVTTLLPDQYRYNASDATGPVVLGRDQFHGHTGLFISAKVLSTGQFHRFVVRDDPKRAALNFASEGTTHLACITPPNYPERPFNQSNVGRIFVYAGSFKAGGPCCFHPDIYRPIRGQQTPYGWLIEVDSGGTGQYDMTVLFLEGP
jgi:hypothetical protein